MNVLTQSRTVELTSADDRLIYAMQLLGDKTRFKMFRLLMTQQEMCVTEIAAELKITASAVSQHFRNFELVGLVEKERMGQRICYILKDNDPLVKELVGITVNDKK